MSAPAGLATELTDAGKAIGLLTDSGDLNSSWFNTPADSLGTILSNASQRAALLRMLDVILPPSTASDIPASEKWYPLLGDKPLGNFYLTANDNGSSVVFGAAGDFGTDNARLRVQLPLINANTGVHAQAGPLRIQLRLHLGFTRPAQPIALEAISVVATIAPPDISAVITLEKFALGDTPPADTVLDPANLGSEAVQLALGLMQQVLQTLAAAAGSEADALAKHLLPLFGIGDPAIPPFPFATLASSPAALQGWLQSLLAGPITTWLGHLAGLMGAGAIVPTGSGTDVDPWIVPLVTIDPQSNLAFTVVRSDIGVRIGMRALANASIGNLQAQADLALIPLNGTAHAAVLPSASFLFVKGPGLVSSAAITADTLRVGLQWNGSSLQPLLELLNVNLPGPQHYDRIDLTNTNSVAAAASAAVQAAILSAVGTGAGRHLAALAAIVAPTADPTSPHLVNPADLVANPATAIAHAHRAALLDPAHNWSALLAEIGALLGLAASPSGTGTQTDPWRILIGSAGTPQVELTAWNAQTSGNAADPQKLRIGLRLSATSAPAEFYWLAELLTFDLPASGSGAISLMAAQHAAFLVQPGPSTPPTAGFTLSTDSLIANFDWTPGSSAAWKAGVTNLKLSANGTTITVPSLSFPAAAGFDVSNPAGTAAALGISVANLELLLRLLLARAALSWGQTPGYVFAALAGVHNALPGLPSDWPALSGFLPDLFPALRIWLGHVTTDLSADGTPFLPNALGWLQSLISGALPDTLDNTFTIGLPDGAGTYEDPWILPLSSDGSTDAVVWLEPAGPPANWATVLGTRASAATDIFTLVGLVRNLAPDAFAGADPYTLSRGLTRLANFLSTSDGVVPVESQFPTGGTWTKGTDVAAAHSAQPQDTGAISQIKTQIDTLAGGAANPRVVLLLGPSFSDHTIWSGLIGGSPTANFDLRVPGIDPDAVNLTTVTTAVDFYTADLSDTGDPVVQITNVVARIAALRPAIPVTLVAHSTSGISARAFTAANSAQVKGLITLGTPHLGADLPFLTDPDVTAAVRAAQALRDTIPAGPIHDAIDHMVLAIDGYKSAAPGKLPDPAPYPVADFAGGAATDTGGKPALALGGTVPGDLLSALKQAVAGLATTAAAAVRPAPTHIAFGLRGHLPYPPVAEGAVVPDISSRANLFRIALTSAAPPPSRPAQSLFVNISLSVPGGWLLNTPNATVRSLEFGVDIATKTTPFLNFHQAAFRAPLVSRISLSDATAQPLLGAVMQSISNPTPAPLTALDSLLSALAAFGVAAPDPHGGLGISADAFTAITTDAASFFASRTAAGLAALGLPLSFGSLPVELDVSGTQLAIRTTSPIQLNAAASLEFDTATNSATFHIGALALGYNAGQLTFAAPPWLAPIPLPPDAAKLKVALNDALPRLLFSSAAGAIIEALTGPGFLVGPLDSFFSNTGGTASAGSALGDGTGGFDGFKLNTLLQQINKLAGFPPGPGFTLPAGFQLTAAGSNPAVLTLSTTAPIGGVLGLSLTASIDNLRHVTPGGTVSVTTPLSGTWPSVTVTFGVSTSGITLTVAPQGIAPIQILPTFSGLGPLMGAVEALLPQALNALLDALAPAPAWLTDILAVAKAIGIYDDVNRFKTHTDDLRALISGNFLAAFDTSKRPAVATSAATFLNSLGIPGTIAASGTTINWTFALGGADSGTLNIALGWDGSGPLATLSAAAVKLGSGALNLDFGAGYGSGNIQAKAGFSVPLASALGVNLAPKLDVAFASSAFQVNIYPLASGPNHGPITITLAPTVGVQTSSGTPQQLVENLILPLAANVAFDAFKSHLTDTLWTGGKTVEEILTAAGIITKGATPPQDTIKTPLPGLLTMASGLLTGLAPISIPITADLGLELTSEGSRFGIGIHGHHDFTTGQYVISALFGAPTDWDAGADAGIVLLLFDTSGNTIAFNPGLSVAGLGIGLTGADDAALVDTSVFRLGGFKGYVFFDAEFQSGPLLDNFGLGMELDQLGLPLGLATGGNVGGNNPVASSLLRSDGGSASAPGDTQPVNPGVDVEAWAWKQPFRIKFGGSESILWIGIHRAFGPIHIDQVGLEIDTTNVALLIDGSVKVAGLTAQAHELTVSVPYKHVGDPSQWSLDLKGLGLSFEGPSVTVAGALIKSDGPPVEYDGLLLIQITEFGFIAIGAYSTPTDPGGTDTYTALFVFAGVFITIGLPPIIEITGLGLGIGYNRELVVPVDLNQIPTFLLVEALDEPDKIADDPMGALLHIRDQIPARRGSFWLAAGLRGTSFVVVHVTAIIYVALDRGLEIGILGVARMALPSDETALASIELALKVRFSTAESLFSIQAQLTSNSYLLSSDCQLTGGFAYFMWFARSQFLLTMGGYHPAFHKEPEYPDVPRLGYHWSFLGVVNLKGESYFALTNSCVMAGTRMEATYGPDWLQVWFTAYCDFLLSWDPFYYDIGVGISVGARFQIEICFFGCVDIDISVSIGATLHVLGPPFHGEVTVDLAVASVTIPFGPSPNPNKQPIPWSDFVQKYLHADQPGNEAVVAHVLTGLLPPEPAGGQPSPGTQDQPWKLATEWSFQTETRMPAMSFSAQTEFDRGDGEWATRVFGHFGTLQAIYLFDIAPMLVDQAHQQVGSNHKMQIAVRDPNNSSSWITMVPADGPILPEDDRLILHNERFRLEPIFSQVSEATYHLLPHDDVPAAARTLPALTGMKLTGIALLQNESAVIEMLKLFDYGFSRPLPFATLTSTILGTLQAFGHDALALALLGSATDTPKTTNAAVNILAGTGFFSTARTDSGLPPAGLHPLATRALKHDRSAPPLLTPITTGLTMDPVGLKPPPVIRTIPPVAIVPLLHPRLRAVLQGLPVPTLDVPPLLHTTVTRAFAASAVKMPRFTAPQMTVVPGSRLEFVRAANAPSPTRIARGPRTQRSFQFGVSVGQAHRKAFTQAEGLISGKGVTVPAGTTHIWDVPLTPPQTIAISGKAIGRVTCLSRAGNPLSDFELAQGQLALPKNCAMVAVSCVGLNSDGIAGWQTGNLLPQTGSTTLLGRRSVIFLPQVVATIKSRVPSAQAMVKLSDAMANQPGVETWLPLSITVVGVLLDVEDLCTAADGDLAIAVTGATLSTPPLRVVGGRRKLLLYDVLKRDDKAQHIVISVASQSGARMAGIVGLAGGAQEWAIRFNGGVPEHLVPDGPSTPNGEITARIFSAATQPGLTANPPARVA
jgi:large repetitive protein